MSWEIAGIITGIIVSVIGGLNAWLMVSLRASFAEFKLDIVKQADTDKQELREWINGSFLRSKEALANQEVLKVQIADLKRERDSDSGRILRLERRYANIQG